MGTLYAIILLGVTFYLLATDHPKEAGYVFGGGLLLAFILGGANFA